MNALEWSQHYRSILRRSRAANSVVRDGIWQKFKLIQAFAVVPVTCKNEEHSSKMTALEFSQHFYHYKSIGFFSDVQGQLTPQTLVCSYRILNPSNIL